MGRYATTVPFYERYREPYPPSLFAEVARQLGLGGKERLLDVGCGPAPLAIGFAPYVAACVGVDPEPAMIAAAGEAAARAGVVLTLVRSRLEDLPWTDPPVDVLTIGRALHWLDRPVALPLIDRLVAPQGAVVVCSAGPAPANPWAGEYRRVRRDFAEDHDERRYRPDLDAWFAGSRFARAHDVRVTERRLIAVDDLVGRTLSLSTTSPEVLGPRRPAFEAALREALLPFAVGGQLDEEVEAVATVLR